MSITTVYQKCKRYTTVYLHILATIPSRIPRDGIIVLLFILSTLAGFGFGFVAGENHVSNGNGMYIEQPVSTSTNITARNDKNSIGGVTTNDTQAIPKIIPIIRNHISNSKYIVASKNGGRYYLPSCNGAKRIHKDNRIWFASESAALAKGYTPAQRCLGL